MGNFLAILSFAPKNAFLALDREQRSNWLRNVAARIQEFTGDDGGIAFSERVVHPTGWAVVLIARIGSDELLETFSRELQSSAVAEYFEVVPIVGPMLIVTPGVNAEPVLARIIEPFLA